MEKTDDKLIYIARDNFDDKSREILLQNFQVSKLDIEDVFTSFQLSKIELRKEYIYVALQFPEFDRSSRTFVGKELHLFVSHDNFLLINKHDLKHAQVFQETKNQILTKSEINNSFSIFYELLDFCLTQEYRVLHKFRSEIEVVMEDIFNTNTDQDQILIIQEIKRNLVNFHNLMEPLADVVVDLQTKYHSSIDEYGIEKLDDSLDKIKKILNNLQNFQEQISIVSETNEAITARSTDRSIRTLTLVNIVLLVPTIITSFFGMNVYFGWSENNPWPVSAIVFTILLATILFVLLLRRTKFFK